MSIYFLVEKMKVAFPFLYLRTSHSHGPSPMYMQEYIHTSNQCDIYNKYNDSLLSFT